MTLEPTATRKAGGARSFAKASFPQMQGLPLVPEDRAVLTEVGLPTGPCEALHVEQQLQGVNFSPSKVCSNHDSQPLSLSFRASNSLATETCG